MLYKMYCFVIVQVINFICSTQILNRERERERVIQWSSLSMAPFTYFFIGTIAVLIVQFIIILLFHKLRIYNCVLYYVNISHCVKYLLQCYPFFQLIFVLSKQFPITIKMILEFSSICFTSLTNNNRYSTLQLSVVYDYGSRRQPLFYFFFIKKKLYYTFYWTLKLYRYVGGSSVGYPNPLTIHPNQQYQSL